MKEKFYRVFMAFIISLSVIDYSMAAETIKIFSPYSASHSGTPALLKLAERANSLQQIYQFVVEFKPGGNQIIAVKSLIPENSLAVIAPAFVDHIASGKLNESDYVPVWALGDACWAVIANKSLHKINELTVGGVGLGNASHLTALLLGERHNFGVRYVVFKSNNDALVNMTGNNGVEMVIDRYENFANLVTKNPKLQMIAASCPQRLPQEPKIPTLKEQGISAPLIFNIVVAHKNMPRARQIAISQILHSAASDIGQKEFYNLSAMRPPQFANIELMQYYKDSITAVSVLQKKFHAEINAK